MLSIAARPYRLRRDVVGLAHAQRDDVLDRAQEVEEFADAAWRHGLHPARNKAGWVTVDRGCHCMLLFPARRLPGSVPIPPEQNPQKGRLAGGLEISRRTIIQTASLPARMRCGRRGRRGGAGKKGGQDGSLIHRSFNSLASSN